MSEKTNEPNPPTLAILPADNLERNLLLHLPVVGLQDDIGVVDVVSKVLQAAIIAISVSMIRMNRKMKVASGVT